MGTFERHRYPANWPEMSLACKNRAAWHCERCGVVHKATCISVVHGTEYVTAIAACHPNNDPENPDAELLALCKACHMRLDAIQHARTRKRKRWQMMTIQQRGAGQIEMALEEQC